MNGIPNNYSHRYWVLTLLLAALFAGTANADVNAGVSDGTPAFTVIPELTDGFHALYAQNFTGSSRKVFGLGGT